MYHQVKHKTEIHMYLHNEKQSVQVNDARKNCVLIYMYHQYIASML